MSRPASRRRIAPFVARYGLAPGEFDRPPESYRSFNDFFARRLRPGARPVDPSPSSLVFPADGRHLGFADLSTLDAVHVKGQRFDLEDMLRCDLLARRYRKGSAVLSRLCPTDCHRFHFPVGGHPASPRVIPGFLYSVSPVALRANLSLLWRNRRAVTRLSTAEAGEVILVEFGATNVGSIHQTHTPDAPVEKGDEKGYFRFGASAVMTLFEPGSVRLSRDLLLHSGQSRELYARMGDVMGTLV